MLILRGESLVLPIFMNITETGIYPDMWKFANVTPIHKIHKKGDKQLSKNYRPISLLPICGKLLEKIIFEHFFLIQII